MADRPNKKTERLWYRKPAECWIEALPIGNGRLGGMVYGGVNKDVVQLNEETIWAGHYQDRNNCQSALALPEIRRLLFANQFEQATKLARQTMVANPIRFDSFQPLGDLTIQMFDAIDYRNYCRELDISEAIASTRFTGDSGTYRREYFCSAVDQVLVASYECDRLDGISLTASLSRAADARSQILAGDTIGLLGRCGEKGVSFCGAVKIICEGGTLQLHDRRREGNEIRANVRQANRVIFLIAAVSNYRGQENFQEECLKILERAAQKGFEKIREDHIKDYRSFYKRFSIRLSCAGKKSGAEQEESTFEWVRRMRDEAIDPDFAVLCVNYNRYLLISSSRPGCLPSTLQGIWNDQMWAPWESDYHTNVNMQINYWPAEGYNLGDCHTPVADWLETLVEHGSLTAKVCYNARGWVLHHASDIWGSTSIFVDTFGIWPMGAAWMSRHLWEHYCHNPDERFLREKAYPIIKGAVRFLLDFMVEAPSGSSCPGKLVCNPSHSPENNFIASDGTVAAFTYGCTMDTEIIHDISTICVTIIDLLGKSEPGFERGFKNEILSALSKLPTVKVSQRTGGIQEWAEDFEEKEPGHRHLSPLYGVYPGSMISRSRTPELAAAAAQTLEHKLAHGYDGQGWSLSWMSCIWARLFESEKAYAALEEVFRHHILNNLFINAHGWPQVGDAQGIPAAILEMLAQSHDGEISLLPALPKAWSSGQIRGMRLRGGCTLDMSWKCGRLEKAILQFHGERNELQIKVNCRGSYTVVRRGCKVFVKNKSTSHDNSAG